VDSRRELVARFAVGSAEGPRSAVWYLWTGKGTSDVYIAARALIGNLKVSLHESGVWRIAFTEEHKEGQASTHDKDRVIERWNRPYSGVTTQEEPNVRERIKAGPGSSGISALFVPDFRESSFRTGGSIRSRTNGREWRIMSMS
jgi:hypothetical protein